MRDRLPLNFEGKKHDPRSRYNISDLWTFFRESISDEFLQSELAMIQFAKRQVLLDFLLCISLFLFIVC